MFRCDQFFSGKLLEDEPSVNRLIVMTLVVNHKPLPFRVAVVDARPKVRQDDRSRGINDPWRRQGAKKVFSVTS